MSDGLVDVFVEEVGFGGEVFWFFPGFFDPVVGFGVVAAVWGGGFVDGAFGEL